MFKSKLKVNPLINHLQQYTTTNRIFKFSDEVGLLPTFKATVYLQIKVR